MRKERRREWTWGWGDQMKGAEHRPSLPPRPCVLDQALRREMRGKAAGPPGIPSTEPAWRTHRRLNLSCKVREEGVSMRECEDRSPVFKT